MGARPDASRIIVRPLEPDDRARLLAGFERLSPEARYRRFFGPMPRLRERDLDYLTRVDHHDHEALLAVDTETGEAVGVARYVRTGPGRAEPAMVVVDPWQGQGVGSRLLDALAARAREEGIQRFVAPVLAGNPEAVHVLERLGETTVRPDGREVELTILLSPAPSGPGRWAALGPFAAGLLEPARTLLEVVLPHRRGPADAPRRDTIVVGTDGSAHADGAVSAARELAARSGASLDVVGVHRFVGSDEEDVREAVHAAAALLREAGLHVHEHVRRGDPALVLPELAVEVDARLVVVGAGERAQVARRLIGSVADRVAERTPCDVLIVRPPRA